MRIHTEYMSLKNSWMISSSYDSQAHQQRSQRRCYFSQTAVKWFVVLPGLLLALRGVCRLVVGTPGRVVGTSRLVACTPRLVVGTSRLVPGSPSCSPCCHQTSYMHPDFSPELCGAAEGHFPPPLLDILRPSLHHPMFPPFHNTNSFILSLKTLNHNRVVQWVLTDRKQLKGCLEFEKLF